jgi:hypothetical protein
MVAESGHGRLLVNARQAYGIRPSQSKNTPAGGGGCNEPEPDQGEPDRSTIVVQAFITLDGVVQAGGGPDEDRGQAGFTGCL